MALKCPFCESENVKERDKRAGVTGSTLAGVAIGATIIPGIGGLAGGLVGWAAGALGSSNTAKYVCEDCGGKFG